MIREAIVKEWLIAWFTPEWNQFSDVFDQNAYYSESWGPEYHGISEIKQWFTKWHRHCECVAWDIKQFHHTEAVTIVEWYFSCKDDEKKHEFDGCSIIEWNQNDRIVSLREFCSTLPNYMPETI